MSSGYRSLHRPVLLFLLLAILFTAGTGIGSAHAPLSVGSHEGIAASTLISNPEKSFVLYTVLDENGEARYLPVPHAAGAGPVRFPAGPRPGFCGTGPRDHRARHSSHR